MEETIAKPQNLEETLDVIVTLKASLDRAFAELGDAMIKLAEEQQKTAESLNAVISDRNDQVALVGVLLQKIEVLTKLVDSDHAAVEVLMAMRGMPGKAGNC